MCVYVRSAVKGGGVGKEGGHLNRDSAFGKKKKHNSSSSSNKQPRRVYDAGERRSGYAEELLPRMISLPVLLVSRAPSKCGKILFISITIPVRGSVAVGEREREITAHLNSSSQLPGGLEILATGCVCRLGSCCSSSSNT